MAGLQRIAGRTALGGWMLLAASAPWPAHAQLFGGDDEARRAILELRQRIEAQRVAADQANVRLAEQLARSDAETAQLRRALLDLNNQIEALKAELARARGREEQATRDVAQLARDLSELQRQQRDLLPAVDERLRRFEPVKTSVDGREFMAEPAEKRDFDAALALFRAGDMPGAQAALQAFLRRWGGGGYAPSATYWLGNTHYASRQYEASIEQFRKMLSLAPEHPRAAEAMLSIGNCQIELKDTRSARRTLEDLVKAHPQSEAAATARERLARLR